MENTARQDRPFDRHDIEDLRYQTRRFSMMRVWHRARTPSLVGKHSVSWHSEQTRHGAGSRTERSRRGYGWLIVLRGIASYQSCLRIYQGWLENREWYWCRNRGQISGTFYR